MTSAVAALEGENHVEADSRRSSDVVLLHDGLRLS